MHRNPIYTLMVFALIVLVVVGYRYKDYILDNNFLLDVHAECGSNEGTCFSPNCSEEGELGCDSVPYKKVEILASEAPKCLEEHACKNFFCSIDQASCNITYCSEESLEEGEECYQPIE